MILGLKYKIKTNILLIIISTIFITINLLSEDNNNTKENSALINNNSEQISDIFLNFENASLSSVVNFLAEQKKINIVPSKDLDNIQVSLSTREPLSLEKAWDILLTLLEINNYSIINVDKLYRIVAKSQSKQEPLPMYSGMEPEELPESDILIRYIYFLKNIKADTVQGFLTTMLEGTIQTNRDLDALIITDKSISIKSAMKIIKELDQGGLREAIKIIRLNYSSADDLAKLFNEIIPQNTQKNIRFIGPRTENKPSTYFSSDTKVIPEQRQNALILLGIEKNIDKIIDFIYKYLDVPIDAAESRLHIKELNYAKAENIKPILENIIKPPVGLPKTLQVGEYKFFSDVIIAADSSVATEGKGGGNRLIISCDKEDWKRLEQFINSVDKPQPQVAFEIMVVDVGLTSGFDLWAQFKPKKEGMLGKHINPYFETALAQKTVDLKYNLPTDASAPIRAGTVAANITFGIPGNLWGMIKTVLKQNNYNVIIQPYITVNNNQECSIDSTEVRQVAGEFSAKTYASNLVQNKKEKDATTKITLTPKVNLNGTVDLKIEIEITDFQSTTETDANTTTRKLNTRINVGTGEVIILGGFTTDKQEEDSYKVPLLGDIPVLGNLFKSKTKTRTKTNLYIFIRPSIIKPKLEGVPDEYTQMKLDYAKHQIMESDTYLQDKDPIQRWFFKPAEQTARQKLSDIASGTFRPIDNYATAYGQPKSVNIKKDTYFRPEEKRIKREEKKELKKQQNLALNKHKRSRRSILKRRQRKIT